MLKYLRIALLSMGALCAFGAMAQPGPDDDAQSSADQPDPPSRVGRLSFVRGAVSFVPAGENDWVEAQINRPLITGDKLWTDHDSRAELEIGSSAIRIDEQTSFDFLNLDDQTAQVELTQGSLNLRVRRLYDNQVYEIDTPTLAFVINRVGEYRVTVAPEGQATIVSVLHGGGDAYGENDARFRIEEGQSVRFNDSALRDYYTSSLPRPDAFDEFIAQRNQRWDGARSRQYVSEDVIGYQDLDDNGDWSDVPEYGHVWYPTTVAVGWTPYHYGHWGWVGAYGWTWIDDASWGFAPFHYGRWAYIGNRWGWCPGPIAVRPYYAPALVAFIGGGVAIGVGGPVGWFPLGPRDVWFPGYHTSHAYFTNINISNTYVERGALDGYYGHYRRGDINYGEINYHNRAIAGAVVAVPAAAFVGARSVHTSAIAVNRETFANARVSSFAAVAPTRASLVASTGRASAVPPAAVLNRRIVAASTPPTPVASFATREALLKKNPGQPLNNAQLRSLPAVQTGARDVKVNERNNVKVVTNNGVPAHTAAAPLVARPAGNGQMGRNVGNSLQNNNTGANGAQNKALKAEEHRGAGNAVDTNSGAGKAAANGNGRQAVSGAQDEHLQSSRFVHGNNSGTGQGNNAQNGNGKGAGNGQVNDRGRAVNSEIKQPGNSVQSTNAGQQATNNALIGGQPANNGTQGNGRNTGQDRKVKSNQSESVNGNGSGNGQTNVQHSNAREYRAPQGPQNNNAGAAQAQSYHAPVQESHANNDRQVQQQQLHVQQQQQIQTQQQVQQHVQQPQYQQPHVQQAPVQQQHNNQGKDNNDKQKKDEDKKNGGGGH
jgi:hypothetical protein